MSKLKPIEERFRIARSMIKELDIYDPRLPIYEEEIVSLKDLVETNKDEAEYLHRQYVVETRKRLTDLFWDLAEGELPEDD